MSLPGLLVRTVEIVTPGWRTDEYGDQQTDWSVATTMTVNGWLAQRSTLEVRDGRDTTVTSYTLVLPLGTVISHRDRVIIDSYVYELTGEPLHAWTPRGEHHIECDLSVVPG